MVQCTDGWKLVGADVDSQEQWMAALFGDSLHESKRAGATAFSNMLLEYERAKNDHLDKIQAGGKQSGQDGSALGGGQASRDPARPC